MPNLTSSASLNLLLSQLPDPVAQLTQPPASNECGAYALTATLAAFAPWPESTTITYQSNTNVINQYDDFITAKDKIYGLTGILNPNGGPNVASNGYNSPAAMGKVAMDFNHTASVSVTTEGLIALGALYPNEQVACVAVVGPQHVHTDANYAAPNAGEVQLICVTSGLHALHILARDSDGLYYDPGTGIRDNDWGDPTVDKFKQESGYEFAGLWLTIS